LKINIRQHKNNFIELLRYAYENISKLSESIENEKNAKEYQDKISQLK